MEQIPVRGSYYECKNCDRRCISPFNCHDVCFFYMKAQQLNEKKKNAKAEYYKLAYKGGMGNKLY